MATEAGEFVVGILAMFQQLASTKHQFCRRGQARLTSHIYTPYILIWCFFIPIANEFMTLIDWFAANPT